VISTSRAQTVVRQQQRIPDNDTLRLSQALPETGSSTSEGGLMTSNKLRLEKVKHAMHCGQSRTVQSSQPTAMLKVEITGDAIRQPLQFTTASLVQLFSEPSTRQRDTDGLHLWFSLHQSPCLESFRLLALWLGNTHISGVQWLSAPEKIRLGMRLPGLQRVYDSWWRMVESDCEPSCVHLERRHELQ
jgi:hypothetical protein